MASRRLVASSLFASLAFGISHSHRQIDGEYGDSPLIDDRNHYVGRAHFGSIVVGNYLYWDGGEIYYLGEDSEPAGLAGSSTYSVDVSTSWTNETISINQINSSIQDRSLNDVKLWPSLDGSFFYSYNGQRNWLFSPPINPPPNKLYKFSPDGTGSGKWSEDTSTALASSNFTNLARVVGSASTCASDTCYAMGGYMSSRTSNLLSSSVPASGLVSYNLETRIWYNESIIGNIFSGPWESGQLFFTDIAGSEGILVAMGGGTTNVAGENYQALSFETVYLYDIATKTWHQQVTGGDIPSITRTEYCTVGLTDGSSVNKTYEIFMYGGASSDGPGLDLDDVWVLSLPSFQWYQAGHTPVHGRHGHACSIVGHRQMAIIGGLDPDNSSSVLDVWPLGIGIFDLSEMVFKDRYDANAVAYTSPAVVKSWYEHNGPMSKNISADVSGLFVQATPTNSGSPLPTGTTQVSDGSPGNSSVNKGAIAGGVVGGVVALAATIAGICIYRRRRHQLNRRSLLNEPVVGTHEKDSRLRHEIAGKQAFHEKDEHQRHELL